MKKYKIVCEPCKQTFKQNENAIASDTCNQWFHPRCISMSDQNFTSHTQDENLAWNCESCANLLDNDTTIDYEPGSEENNQGNKPTLKKVEKLAVLVCNFQSIWNKRNSLELFVEKHKVDVVVGSETHLKPSIKNLEFIPPGFLAKRKDRDDGYGGVIIIYRDFIKVNEILHDIPEIVSIKIETHQKPVIISACYRSMHNTNEQNKLLSEEIAKIGRKNKNNHIWIGGDFNLPDIDWSNNSIVTHQYSKDLNEQFLETFENSSLLQVIDFHTRKKATLDLMFTNRPTFLSKCTPVPGFGDHNTAALVDLYCHPQRHRLPNEKYSAGTELIFLHYVRK